MSLLNLLSCPFSRSLFLLFFLDTLHINVTFLVEPLYKSFLDRLPTALAEKLAVLNYIPGSFDLKEALSVLGTKVVDDFFFWIFNIKFIFACENIYCCHLGPSGDIEKEDTMETFFHRHLISQTTGDRFDIHGILRDCLKEYFKIKDIKG